MACDRPITSWVVATCRTPPREQTHRHDWKHYLVKSWFNYSLVFIESIVLSMMMLAWWLFAVNNLIVQNTVWHNRTPEQVLLFDVLWCIITLSHFSLIDFNLIRLWVSIHFISHFLKYIHAYFFLNFGRRQSFLWGHWYPCFGLLVMSPLGFKARVSRHIHPWQRCMCYTFPKIHLWCDICWPLGDQHGSWAVLPPVA